MFEAAVDSSEDWGVRSVYDTAVIHLGPALGAEPDAYQLFERYNA